MMINILDINKESVKRDIIFDGTSNLHPCTILIFGPELTKSDLDIFTVYTIRCLRWSDNYLYAMNLINTKKKLSILSRILFKEMCSKHFSAQIIFLKKQKCEQEVKKSSC